MKIDDVLITNADRSICGIKKIDVVKYYKKISPLILPFLNKKPISEIRCHGDESSSFFKKHNGSNDLIFISSSKELTGEVQMGTVEFHVGGHSTRGGKSIMVFDFDPNDDVKIETLQDGVLKCKELLDRLNLKSYLKTSGKKGYHVVVPFKKAKDYDKFEDFSKNIALLLEAQNPTLFTSNIRKDNRKGKIFIDFLRNKNGATCVAPYSLRIKDGLPVSMPIHWKNLDKIAPSHVNIKNIDKFLKNNPWADFWEQNHLIR